MTKVISFGLVTMTLVEYLISPDYQDGKTIDPTILFGKHFWLSQWNCKTVFLPWHAGKSVTKTTQRWIKSEFGSFLILKPPIFLSITFLHQIFFVTKADHLAWSVAKKSFCTLITQLKSCTMFTKIHSKVEFLWKTQYVGPLSTDSLSRLKFQLSVLVSAEAGRALRALSSAQFCERALKCWAIEHQGEMTRTKRVSALQFSYHGYYLSTGSQ